MRARGVARAREISKVAHRSLCPAGAQRICIHGKTTRTQIDSARLGDRRYIKP
jgi:hypothetical protein